MGAPTSTPSNDIVYGEGTVATSSRDLYIMNGDGSNQRNLTNYTGNPSYSPSSPQWSPTKSKVYFGHGIASGGLELWSINANGTGLTDMGVSLSAFALSPDGNNITFAAGGEPGPIEVLGTSGGSPVSVGMGIDPSWSPDSSRIVYVDSNSMTISSMNADGSGVSLLFSDPLGAVQNPVYSPSGTQIAFWSLNSSVLDIWVMNSDGTSPTNLTTGLTSTTVGASNPCWSPDGTKIAYTWYVSPNAYAYVMNADGSGKTQISNGNFHDSLHWSPDSQYVFFEETISTGFGVGVGKAAANGSGAVTIATADILGSGLDWIPNY